MNSLSALLTLSLSTLSLLAGEHVVKPGPLETKMSFEATVLPDKVTLLSIEPQEWKEFRIASVTDHGALVTAGQTIVTSERKDYDLKLIEAKEGLKKSEIELAQAERELAELEAVTAIELEKTKVQFERKQKELDHHLKIVRPLEEKRTQERANRAKRQLEYVEEELKQLLKMYEEDGVTEETEEIILKRQRSNVETAKLGLEKAEADTKWALAHTIPNTSSDKETQLKIAKSKFETTTANLPRKLELKRLAVAKIKRAHELAQTKLADLEKDGAFLEISSPKDGRLFHGAIKDGRWRGDAAKNLRPKQKLPLNTHFLSVIEDGSPLTFHAHLDQAKRLALKPGLSGTATILGMKDTSIAVSLNTLDSSPDLNSHFAVSLTIQGKAPEFLSPGLKGTIDLLTYQNKEALTVPSSALTKKDGKSYVKVKMADGKSEEREVQTGHRSEGKVEILSGLTSDQVVLVPDEEKS